MVTKTSKKRVEKYECKKCDYETSYKYNWERHITTLKHKMITNDNKNESKRVKKTEYVCECGKNYKFLSGLSRHKKQCFYIEELSEYENKILEKENIIEQQDTIIDKKDKQLEELMNVVTEIMPTIKNIKTNKVVNNTINNINNVNNVNNINIQLFLNDKCSDAMSIQNFTNQLTIKINDLIKEKNNLTISIPNILLENLKPLAITERPMHLDILTDNNNPIWMVKDDIEGWKKDDGQLVVKQTEYGIHKQFQDLWNKKYPNWNKDDRLKELNIELWKCLLTENSELDIKKILKKIEPKCKLTYKAILNCKNIN